MCDPIENISILQKQLNDLQLENQILKNIPDQAGVSYKQSIARLKAADEMANNFFARLWGRQDVYAKRNEKKDTGKAGYFIISKIRQSAHLIMIPQDGITLEQTIWADI